MFARLRKLRMANNESSEHSRYRTAKIAAIVVASALLLQLLSAPMAFADNFSCGNIYNSSPHCYASVNWQNTPWGATGYVTVVNLSCTCNNPIGVEEGFVNNEEWLNDSGDTNCRNFNNNCWLEAGYTDPGGIGGTLHYFWADVRPDSNGGNYHGHELSNVPSGDLNHNVHIVLLKDQTRSGYFDWALYTATGTYSGVSTGNNMSPTDVTFGTELAGYGTVSAPNAYFTNLVGVYDSNYDSRTLIVPDGTPTNNQPPYLAQQYYSFYTHCC